MADKKISALTAAGTLDGTELVPVVQSGSTVKTTTAAIAALGGGGNTTVTQAITSGAAPVDVTLPSDDTWRSLVVSATSGNTGGTETINVPNPTLDANNYNGKFIGRNVVVQLQTQAGGSDTPVVTINGGDQIVALGSDGQSVGNFDSNHAVIDYEGAFVTFVWQGYQWFATGITVYGNDSNWAGGSQTVRLPLPSSDGLVPKSSGAGYSPSTTAGFGIAVGSLPMAITQGGNIYLVTDATLPVIGSPVVGGGGAMCLVCSNGTDWIVIALL
jgi:hypothetical protein